jgi:outer membrane protein OmpA-like peptidoglycan-associated protein
MATVALIALQTPVQAQVDTYTKPTWYFGAAGGANFNFYRGSTQQINDNLLAPVAFHDGMGVGLYLAPTVEYYSPTSMLGLILQAGYDSRKGVYETQFSPCNCPRDLSTKLTYLTVEPSLRFAPFKSPFYLYAGPRIAYNLQKSFVYDEGPNPNYPEQVDELPVEGDLSQVKTLLVSGQVGAGYDISLWGQSKGTQMVLSPFISFQPYFGQSPRNIETWNVTTLRIGASLKIGRGSKIRTADAEPVVIPTTSVPVKTPVIVKAETTEVVAANNVIFSVTAPENIPVLRNAKEIFPLRNYVFFDLGSTEIPTRYVYLSKDQVKDFKEDQVSLFVPQNLSGRSERQMIVYYNILNILGDRMVKNPDSKVTLVGSSEKGPSDGLAMAESIKKYLTNTWGIKGDRISTSGRDKPAIPSEKPGSTSEFALLREGDRRVSIESGSPALLMEFQNGPTAPLKPVEIRTVQEAPVDSYVSFTATDVGNTLKTWSIHITDDEGTTRNFGPYTEGNVTLPGKEIMGTRPEGDFVVVMRGETNDGSIVASRKVVHMVLWTPPVTEEVTRFSVIYEFDDSNTLTMYENYITDVIVPKVKPNSTVMIHGYTDVIGDRDYNQSLSLARANDVKSILEKGLAKAGTQNVKLTIHAFGEDPALAPFENNFPEERFYNRTVIIDIISQK